MTEPGDKRIAQFLSITLYASLLLALPAWSVHAGAVSAAKPSSGIQVAVISHGIKLSLIVPHRAYPAHALVRVMARVRNVSHQKVLIFGYPMTCISYNPGVQVTNAAGQVVYPPPITAPPPCPPPPGQPLLPGQTVEQRLLAVLDGPYLRATVQVQEQNNSSSTEFTVTTPQLALRLLPAMVPHIALHVSGTTISAVVRRPAHAQGLLYYDTELIRCPDGSNGSITGGGPVWARTFGNKLLPECTPVTEWHVLAGWLNHSVASIDYVKG